MFNRVIAQPSLNFKKNDNMVHVPSQTVPNVTPERLEVYISSPSRYMSELVTINRHMYLTSPLFMNHVNFLADAAVYRWTIRSSAKDVKKYLSIPLEKRQKNLVSFAWSAGRLKIKNQINHIFKKLLIEDVVCAYWLDDGNSEMLYYFPPEWCQVVGIVDGNLLYTVNSKAPSNKVFDAMPKEIQSLLGKYRAKNGDESKVLIPPDKSFCIKWNSHFDYIYPPLTSIIKSILGIDKKKQIDEIRDENKTIGLIQMKIPTDEKTLDNLYLSLPMVEEFAKGAMNILPPQIAAIPTPMEMTAIDINKSISSERDIVSEALKSYNIEAGIPSFGAADTAAEMKMAIDSNMSHILVMYNQISGAINLKFKVLNIGQFTSYELFFDMLPMHIYNVKDYIEMLEKQCQSGRIAKTDLEAAYGNPPDSLFVASDIENVLFQDVFNKLTVLPSSHTQTSEEDSSGRPTNESKGDQLSESGQTAQDNETNDPVNRGGAE